MAASLEKNCSAFKTDEVNGENHTFPKRQGNSQIKKNGICGEPWLPVMMGHGIKKILH